MTAAALLPGLSGWISFQRLFAALDMRGAWHPLDPAAIDAGPVISRMAALTTASELPWLLLSSRESRVAARVVARARTLLGSPAGIACLDPAARTLVLTVALDRAPVLEIHVDRPDPVAIAVLERLPTLRRYGALEAAAMLAEWLAIEPVGNRFFRQFAATFEAVQLALPPGPPPAERAALALLQLTRVLFLYFVQSKGWLDGRSDFLAGVVDDAVRQRRDLHRHLLKPLWFGTLNQPPARRAAAAGRFGDIPFLNGGLFEPHPLERRWRSDIPTPVWRDAFDSLFERYQFVTREGDTTAIGPDTLGRVFEGLMDPHVRHRSGSYYTPGSLVRSVMLEAFSAYLSRRLHVPELQAAALIEQRHESARVILSAVSVLDPAAGSGAFLLGALELLADITRGRESTAEARRRVITANLFGVDINPTAVRLAELRLWLAVISQEQDGAAGVAPLPNLDAVVRQGDSLWDRLGHRVRPDAATAAHVRRARLAVIAASGAHKRGALRELRRAEVDAGRRSLDIAVHALESAMAERMAAARGVTLFGEPGGLSPQDRAWLRSARLERRRLREASRHVTHAGQLEHFDYHVHFGDVLAAGGFDVVAGNPPWVRGEQVPPEVRRALSARYNWYRPAGGSGYRNAPDLSIAFIERGFELLRPGGVLAFLVPSKLRHAGYAEMARQWMARHATLHAVAEVEREDARAFGATVYPMVLVASGGRAPVDHRVRTSHATPATSVAQSAMVSAGPWLLSGDAPRLVAQRLAAAHPPVADRWKVQLGVKTGADDIYLTRVPDIEASLLRPAIRGRDLASGAPRSELWLRWPCDARGAPLRTLPPRAAAWYARHATRLKRRSDYRDGPGWRLFRTRAAVAPFRVVWADLSRQLTAFPLLPPEHAALAPLNTCYVVALDSPAGAIRLAQLLNSTWLRALAAQAAPVASGGFRRFGARIVEALPCPAAAWDSEVTAASGPDADEQVADWLGLSTDERHALADLAQARH